MNILNPKLQEIEEKNTFSRVSALTKAYQEAHPEKRLISLGIGDVSKPLIEPIRKAMHEAVDELGEMKSFRGYGNYYGIASLRKAILDNEYSEYGFSVEEIYVSDGTKSDSTNILELFDKNCTVLTGDPQYPIYKNGALALGRDVYTTPLNKEGKMIVPKERYDVVYLCSPNNPTGVVYQKEDLEEWIAYCLKNHSYLLFDNVYMAFVRDERVPRSIYDLDGAKQCAIEFRSFSKVASFTGVRCSYFVLPKEIDQKNWRERTINRFNGASYIAQKGAEASFGKEARALLKANIDDYLKNAHYLKSELSALGFEVLGGEDAPFMWVKNLDGLNSFEMYDLFLKELNIIVIPGIIFGHQGDDHVRISALGKYEDSVEAIRRIREYVEKKA